MINANGLDSTSEQKSELKTLNPNNKLSSQPESLGDKDNGLWRAKAEKNNITKTYFLISMPKQYCKFTKIKIIKNRKLKMVRTSSLYKLAILKKSYPKRTL